MSHLKEENRAWKKCSFAKQHLNPKMPKCHLDVLLSEKDLCDLCYTMCVGEVKYNFSYNQVKYRYLMSVHPRLWQYLYEHAFPLRTVP